MNDDQELLRIEDYDDCVIGIGQTWHGNMLVDRLIYDGEKMLDKMVDNGMDREDALEYMDFNILAAYMGDSTPIVLWPVPEELLDGD